MRKKFKFLNYAFIVEIARPKTVWWNQFKDSKKKPLQRVDSLFSLERVFIRKPRVYIYSLKIGRLRIIAANTSQKVQK